MFYKDEGKAFWVEETLYAKMPWQDNRVLCRNELRK